MLTIYTNDWDRAELIWQNRFLEMELEGATSLKLITCINGFELTHIATKQQQSPSSPQKQLELFAQLS